ncbi:MAG: right-handed parallel beta-helix repeat-containing protein, partial [Acidimicrobiales bacterium]
MLVVLALFSSLLAQVTPTAAGAQDKVDAYGCDIARSPGRDVIVRSNDELSNAIRSRQPGDDIQIATNRRLRAISMNSGTAGQPKNWITVRAADGFKPRIRARGHLGVDVRVPYVQICDVEVVGRSRARKVDDTTRTGILVLQTHHVRIVNTNVHNFSVGGIAVNHSNNIEIVGNEVARNSFWGAEQGSGISVFKPDRSLGDFEGRYQIVIAGNRSHHNRNRVVNPYRGKATDGNGIILDDFRNVFPGG